MNILIESQREKILYLAKQRGVYNVRLFGSMARNVGTRCSAEKFTNSSRVQSSVIRYAYQAEQAMQHDDSLALSIDEQLKKEVAELKLKLIEQQTTISEHQSTIKQLARKVEDSKYVPHLEKTYQAHLHGMIGGTR